MNETFFEHPILDSPYEHPHRHWELDQDGQLTNRIIEIRRRSDVIIPRPKAEEAAAGKRSNDIEIERPFHLRHGTHQLALRMDF